MTPKMHEFLVKQTRNVIDFRRALSKESDRGCALFAAAYLDKSLGDLLFLSLVDTGKIDQDLLTGTAPLHSFSARINMAFYLGRISQVCRRELHLVRGIRNHFAHHAEVVSFDEQAMANKCRELNFSFHEKKDAPRDHFCSAVVGVLALINMTAMQSVAPTQKPNDAPTEEAKTAHRDLVAGLEFEGEKKEGQQNAD